MNKNTIDASMLSKMFLAGAKNLEAKKEWINELNVFPVPDGDTGTNMTLTIMAAAAEVSQIQDLNMEKLAKAISSGSLRGARGNSGVIPLSASERFYEKCGKASDTGQHFSGGSHGKGCGDGVQSGYEAEGGHHPHCREGSGRESHGDCR